MENKTSSDIPIKDVYTPSDIKELNYYHELGDPGSPPYTREGFS